MCGGRKYYGLKTKCHEDGDAGTHDALIYVLLGLVLQCTLHRGMVKVLGNLK